MASYLEGRLVCVRFIDGRMAFGVFKGLAGDDIKIEKPKKSPEGIVSKEVSYNKDRIGGITHLCEDLFIAHVLTVGARASKKVERVLRNTVN